VFGRRPRQLGSSAQKTDVWEPGLGRLSSPATRSELAPLLRLQQPNGPWPVVAGRAAGVSFWASAFGGQFTVDSGRNQPTVDASLDALVHCRPREASWLVRLKFRLSDGRVRSIPESTVAVGVRVSVPGGDFRAAGEAQVWIPPVAVSVRHKLVTRVDLKADRANKRLLVIGKWFEQRKTAATAAALSTELRALGHCLGLSHLMNQSSRKASGCD
jgi:hypothetical protein